MNQDDKKKVIRETLSLYPRDWAVVQYVMEQFNMKRSQAMRVILHDYHARHNLPLLPRRGTKWCDNCQCFVERANMKRWPSDDGITHFLCDGCDAELDKSEITE